MQSTGLIQNSRQTADRADSRCRGGRIIKISEQPRQRLKTLTAVIEYFSKNKNWSP